MNQQKEVESSLKLSTNFSSIINVFLQATSQAAGAGKMSEGSEEILSAVIKK